MLELINITKKNRTLVTSFIENAGESLTTFRYFESRPISILDNHLVTYVLKIEDQIIGYGHLDKEEENIWLGIAISSKFKGQGLGQLMMQALIASAKILSLKEITLAVDKINEKAINLYTKNKFKIIKEGATNLFFKLELS